MHVGHALALRRVAVGASALAATLGAHVAATGELHLTRAAPVMWGVLLIAAAMCGARRRFLLRSLGATTLLLVVAQAALHVVMTGAPWAVGMTAHVGTPLVDARSLVVHAAAALVLTLMLRGLDRMLAAALAVVRLLTADPRPRRTRAGAPERVVAVVRGPHARPLPGPLPARGPPAGLAPAALTTA